MRLAGFQRELSLTALVGPPIRMDRVDVTHTSIGDIDMNRQLRLIVLTALAVLAIGAYSAFSTTSAAAPSDRAVDEAQATEIATNALNAFNAGDYAGWTRDWSGTMKSAIKESDFLGFRDQLMAAKGRFVAIESVDVASNKPGTYRYTFTVAFEKGSARLGFSFAGDSPSVEGVFYE